MPPVSNQPPGAPNPYGSRPTTPITLTRVNAILKEAPGPDCSEDDIVLALKGAVNAFVQSGNPMQRASAVLRDAGCAQIVASDLLTQPQRAARHAGNKAFLVEALTEVLAESSGHVAAPPLADEAVRTLQAQVYALTHRLDATQLAPSVALDPLANAERLIAQKDFAQAETVLRQALLLDPHRLGTQQLLGKTLNRLNRPAEAEAYLTTALRFDATHANSLLEMGKTLYHLGRDNEAQAHLRGALDANPDSAEAMTALGMALLDWSGTSIERTGLGVSAERLYRAMLAGRPDNAEALFGLGRAFMVQGRDKRIEAERFLRASMLRDPNNPSIKAALAMSTPSRQEGEKLLEAAIQSAPNVPRFACAMGLFLDKHDRNPRTEMFLRKAYDLQPNAVKFAFALGDFYCRRMTATSGVQYLQVAAGADPFNARVQLALATCMRELFRPVEMETALLAVLSRIPHHPSAVDMMAALLTAQGRLTEAEPFLRSVFRKFATDQNRLRLSACLLGLKRPREVEALLEQAVAPPYSTRRDTMLAKSLKMRGRFPEALAYYRQLTEAEPNQSDHQREMGSLLMRLGRYAEAETCLQKAVHLQGDVGREAWKSNRELLAQLFWFQGKLGQAERAMRHELQRGGRHAPGFVWMSQKLLEVGQHAQAENYAGVATRLAPLDAANQVTMGRALFFQRRPADALAYFLEAVRINPNDGILHEELGRCWAALNDAAEAERSFRSASRHGNDSPAVRDGLARARLLLHERRMQPS